VLTDEDLEDFLRPHLAAQSIEACRSAFPRWRHQLALEGIDHVPSPLSTAPSDARAVNLLCLLVRQHSDHRDAAMEHNLRNVAGVRPYKL